MQVAGDNQDDTAHRQIFQIRVGRQAGLTGKFTASHAAIQVGFTACFFGQHLQVVQIFIRKSATDQRHQFRVLSAEVRCNQIKSGIQ